MPAATKLDIQELMKSLEENLEFSTVTETRQDFLPTIECLQKNPARRFVITRHGKPLAVLVSYPTYDTLKKMVQLVMQSWDAMTESERRESALDRFRTEQGSIPVQVAAAAGRGEPDSAKAALEDLQAKLESVQTAARVLEQKVAG